MIRHIAKIRTNKKFKNAMAVIVPESNLGFEAVWCAKSLNASELTNYCIMREDVMSCGVNGYGMRMNKDLKKAMAVAFKHILELDQLKWHEGFFTTMEKSNDKLMKDEVIRQLTDYSVILKRPTHDKFAAPTEIYSGKSGYGYDDIAIAIQMLPIMKNRFMTCPERYKIYW